MRLSFKTNTPTIVRQFEGIPKRFITRGKQVIGRNAGIIQRRVAATAPRDTNFMAEHVDVVRFDDGLGAEIGWYAPVFIEESESHQFYPPHVEKGTEWTPAQPSLGPAHAIQVPVIIAGIRRIMVDVAEGK